MFKSFSYNFLPDPMKYYSNNIALVLLAYIETDDSGERLFQLNWSFVLFCFFFFFSGREEEPGTAFSVLS